MPLCLDYFVCHLIGVGISLSSDCMNLFLKNMVFSCIGSFLYLIKDNQFHFHPPSPPRIKMFNIKTEIKAVFVKWASRSYLDVTEEKWYPNELLAKNSFSTEEVQRKKKYSIVKSNDEPLGQERRRMQSCSPPQMLAGRHPPSPTRSNASVAPQGEGAAALRQ